MCHHGTDYLPKMKFLLPHLGLGDAILLAGAAVELARRHGGLVFPCYPKNYESISSFFRLHPEIMVLPAEDEADAIHLAKLHADAGVIAVGHYSTSAALPGERFDEWMYRTAGVPLAARWDACPLARAALDVDQFQHHPVPFYHDDPLRGFVIEDKWKTPILIHPCLYGSRSILAFASILEYTTAIHVINSSFLQLAESLPTTGKLILHARARANEEQDAFDIPTLRKPWEIVR